MFTQGPAVYAATQALGRSHRADASGRAEDRMMNSASKSLYKRTLPEKRQVPVGKPAGRRRFAMIDAAVLADLELSATSKLVFQAMTMESYSSGQIAISHQGIAKLCGSHRTTVQDALKQLCSHGLIETMGNPEKQVQRYKLNVVPTKAGLTPAVRRPKPTVLCQTCGKLRYGLLRVGYCRSCNWKRNVRAVFHEEMAKTA